VFPLRRYLAKVFSLSNHFDSLLKNVAYSFRMGPALKTLTMKTIDPIHTNFAFHVSESVLRESLVSSDVVSNVVVDNGTLDDVVSTTMGYLSRSAQFNSATGIYEVCDAHVHCEALLLRHHLLDPGLPPFPYIGVSKLCCYTCHALFDACNKTAGPGEQKYYTKGCHNNLYPLWPIPEFGEPRDEQIRSQLVQEHFVFELEELLKSKNTRAGSDSTDVSTGSADAATSTPIIDYGMYPCHVMTTLPHLHYIDAINAHLAAARKSRMDNNS
jgi:hypothetical protein